MDKKLIALAFVACVLFACKQQQQEEPELKETLFLTDELLEVVSVDTVRATPLDDELLLNGRVTIHPEQVAYVYPMFGGVLTDVRVEAGDYIKKGETLAIIRSSEVAELQTEKISIQQELAIAKRNLQSVTDLFESGMASELELLQARQEVINAESEQKRIDELFAINHITENSFYTLISPVSGFVVEKNINRDMLIRSDQGEALFTISGLEDVWITADVYESDISTIHLGAPVRITTLAYKDKKFTGKVDKISHILDDESKTMSIRVKLKNENYLLKPGLFANVYVQKRIEDKIMPRVPMKAVIFEDGKNYVVRVGEGKKLELQEVNIYKYTEHYSYLQEGVKEGDKVIHENALLVYNAIK